MKYKKYFEQFILLLIWFAVLYTNQLSAQTLTTITVKPGEDLTAIYKQMYRFPQFMYGKVYFMNKDSAKGRLNYNILMGKMQFIDKRGDTLVLSDDNPIRFFGNQIIHCNCVIADDLHLCAKLAKIMDEVVGEAVVIV